MSGNFKISIVIPIMNEEGNVYLLFDQLQNILTSYFQYEIIFIDDGSTDGTLEALRKLKLQSDKIKYISFSKNFGHQNALKAGLDCAKGDCVISMDGDLQHPPALIPQLIEKWQEGYDIVYTLRKDSVDAGILKRISARIFYYVIRLLSDIDIKQGCADFRLLDRSVVEVIRPLQENPIFFRGIIPWLGFRQFAVEYVPQDRQWGRTKYSFKKMIGFALVGITSFSVKPLHFSTFIGSVIALMAFGYGLYAIYIKFFTSIAIEGWTSLLVIMSFIGGIQLIMIGILGEYLGKLFMAQKRRPHYIIKEKSND